MGLAAFNRARRLKEAKELTQEDKKLDIYEMNVDELKELAKEKGIKKYYDMKKDELIAALEGDK